MLNHILLSVGLYCSSRVGVGQGVKTGDHDDYMQLKKKKKKLSGCQEMLWVWGEGVLDVYGAVECSLVIMQWFHDCLKYSEIKITIKSKLCVE